MEEKKQSFISKAWGIIYPLLIWVVIRSLVTNIYWYCVLFRYFAENGIPTGINITNEIYAEINAIVNSNAVSVTLVCDLLASLLLLIFYFADKRKSGKNGYVAKSVGTYVKTAGAAVSSCLLFNLITSFIMVIAVLIFGEEIIASYEQVNESISSAPMLLQVVCVVIFAPISEEILMRGLVFKHLRKYTSFVASAIISSVLFGLIHGNWVQFVYAFAIGFVSAFIFEYTDNLKVSCFFHIVANGISTLLSESILSDVYKNILKTNIGLDIVLIATVFLLIFCLSDIKKKFRLNLKNGIDNGNSL